MDKKIGRSRITYANGAMRLEIPTAFNLYNNFFTALFMVVLGIGTVAFFQLYHQGAIVQSDYMSLLIVTAVQAYCAYYVLRNWFGYDLVTINSRELTVGSRLFGFGSSEVVETGKIRNLETAAAPSLSVLRKGMMDKACVVFDDQQSKYSFANSVDLAEAQALVVEILHFNPKLGNSHG